MQGYKMSPEGQRFIEAFSARLLKPNDGSDPTELDKELRAATAAFVAKEDRSRRWGLLQALQ